MKVFLIIGLVIVAGLLIGILWLLPGAIRAKGKPSEWEISMARLARHFATPSQWRDATNPVSPTPEVMTNALHHFANHCATCHANDGSGKTLMGPNFYPPIPDPEEISQMKEFNPMTTQERAKQEAMDAFLSGKDFELPLEHHH